MNKRLRSLFGLILLFSVFHVKGQGYVFSQYTSAYSNISSATVISSPYWDDFTVYGVKLPFNVKFFGTTHDSIYMMGGFAGFIYDGAGSFGDDEIYFYDALLVDHSGSATISYAITGSSPNRIIKFQTTGAGFNSDTSADENNFTNVQLWLYETSNIIEIHNGSNKVDPYTLMFQGGGPTVGIFKNQTSFVSLSGPASNPVASTTSVSLWVTGAPPNGKVYRFAPGTTGIDDPVGENGFSIYPNPSNGTFSMKAAHLSGDAELIIYNDLGQEVYKRPVATNKSTINTGLPGGIYTVVIRDKNSMRSKHLVIQ